MTILDVKDPSFAAYGQIVEGYDFSELIGKMKEKPISQEIVYVASDPSLEALPVFEEVQERFYGGLPAELGYCMGHNDRLDALEYHRGSELNIAVTDYVVMIGKRQDIDSQFHYDTSKVKAFYVHEGMGVEFYSTTLHYCACHVRNGGYCHATFLPAGTNTDLASGMRAANKEDEILFQKNKWLLVHKESGILGVPLSLEGENLKLEPKDYARWMRD